MAHEVHFVARQAGSAYPLGEIAKILLSSGFRVQVFSLEYATPVLMKAGLNPTPISCSADYLQLDLQPDLIFTGTSAEAQDDSLLWKWAKEKEVPALAWLDQPINLHQRFTANGKTVCLPSHIFANDSRTLNAFRESKIPIASDCFGSPYLTELKKHILRGAVDNRLAVFASEPTPPEYASEHGMTDVEAFRLATKFVEQLRAHTDPKWRLGVHLHPRDNPEQFLNRLGRPLDTQDAPRFMTDNKISILNSAAIILGMRSMLLYEASSIGVPTFSFQPNSKTRFPFIDDQPNIRVFTDDRFDFSWINQPVKIDPANTFDEYRFLLKINDFLELRP